jgi:hypothetical protein
MLMCKPRIDLLAVAVKLVLTLVTKSPSGSVVFTAKPSQTSMHHRQSCNRPPFTKGRENLVFLRLLVRSIDAEPVLCGLAQQARVNAKQRLVSVLFLMKIGRNVLIFLEILHHI